MRGGGRCLVKRPTPRAQWCDKDNFDKMPDNMQNTRIKEIAAGEDVTVPSYKFCERNFQKMYLRAKTEHIRFVKGEV